MDISISSWLNRRLPNLHPLTEETINLGIKQSGGEMRAGTFETRSWSCPFCNRVASRAEGIRGEIDLGLDNADGLKQFIFQFAVCPNPDCKKFSLNAFL